MTPSRTSYLHIEPVWAFYLLAGLAVAVFVFGFIAHLSGWVRGMRRQAVPFSWHGISNLFFDGLLGRRIFRGDISAGTMHILIMWGFLGLFVGTVLISVDYWIYHFLTGWRYLLYSTCLEVAGLMLLVGVVWALIRRYLQRVSQLEQRLEDLTVVALLLVVVLSGFLVEGLRLAAQTPLWTRWSFAGHWVSLIWAQPQAALAAYPYVWWVHALLSLGLIAYIPYCKLFHMLAAPASIYLENRPLQAVPVDTRGQDGEFFSYRDMISFDACTRCGRCVEVCPSTGAGEPFAPRDFIVWARSNLLKKHHPLNRFSPFKKWLAQRHPQQTLFSPQKLWHCTTCRACLEVCPIYMSTPDAIQHARGELVEEGTDVPELLFQTLERLTKYNNPLEATKKKRSQWSQGLEVLDFSQDGTGKKLCYFVGCTTSMDIRAQELARSFSRILKYAQTPFATLGNMEPCCGDIARRVGEDGLFEEQMEGCLELFDRYDISDVVTSSPHCFHAFRNEYPAFQALKPANERVNFRVLHYTQFLNRLLKDGSLKFKDSMKAKVTYHDPCYLGRHNQVYNDPREMISAIPGVEMVEMVHHKENSLCCGGGGGRMWQDELDAEVKMSEIRIREAEATGAQILITACPLCLIMLEDACKTTGLEDTLKIMDLNELVVMALGLHEKK